VATYADSLINICRGWTNNGNTGQYWNQNVCVGCTERGQIVGARSAGASVTILATLLGVSRPAVSKVMTTYTSWEIFIS